MIEAYDAKEKACERRYNLSCKVIVKDCTYEDEQSKGNSQVTEKLVFLLPQDNTERTLFYNAWLPEMVDEHQELGAVIGHPLYSSLRVALWRSTSFVNEIHLFVMSKGAEEVLKTMNEKIIQVEILGQGEDQLLDGQKDFELTLNKNKYEKVTSIGGDNI